MVAGAAKIRVNFRVDADGLLAVMAEETSTGTRAQVEVKPAYGLSDEDMITMLRSSVEHASSDASARMLAEARVDARRLIEALEAALNEDAVLLNREEMDALRLEMDELTRLESTADVQAIKQQTKTLSEASDEFAARRMNREIRKALQGQTVDALSSEP